MDDLFQIGCIGLMKAVDNFKLEYNVNFSTYAVPMILGEIRRYLRDNNYIHMSRYLKINAQKIQNARELYLQKNQKEPTLSELAEEVGIPPEEIILAYNANMEPLSFFEPVYNDSTDPLHIIDLLKDAENCEERMLETVALKEALEKLEPRERYILIARFFQGKTQTEVARRVGISQAQISRIEKAALKFIRRHYREGAGVLQEKDVRLVPATGQLGSEKMKGYNFILIKSCRFYLRSLLRVVIITLIFWVAFNLNFCFFDFSAGRAGEKMEMGEVVRKILFGFM